MPASPSGPTNRDSPIVLAALKAAFENVGVESASAERTELTEWTRRLRDVVARHVSNIRTCDIDHETYDVIFEVLLGICSMLVNSPHFPIAELSDNDRECLILISYFVQEFDVAREAIRNGHFAKACAALKQDIETLARIRAIARGRDRPGQVPPIRYVVEGLRRSYGALNDFAHMSRADLLSLYLVGPDNYEKQGETSPPQHVVETLQRLQNLLGRITLEIVRESLFLFLDRTNVVSREVHVAIRHLVFSERVLRTLDESLASNA